MVEIQCRGWEGLCNEIFQVRQVFRGTQHFWVQSSETVRLAELFADIFSALE